MTYKLWLHSLVAVEYYQEGTIVKLSKYTLKVYFTVSIQFNPITRYL